jgi:ribosomal protein S18 acetylase RimI-like enzyme
MPLIQACLDHLDQVNDLIRRVTIALIRQGIFQWDETYPNRAFLRQAILDGNLFVYVDDGNLIGSVVLDEWQAPEWSGIEWLPSDSAVLVIHALAIEPHCQGRGYGTALLQACEQLAFANGYKCIRLDTFEGNAAAKQLYERHGYQYRGMIQYRSKPHGHQVYLCYEKIIR